MTEAVRPPFGTVLGHTMAIAHFREERWGAFETQPVAPLAIHPAAHVLHYSSTCFEGFKAHRWPDGSIRLFRLDSHIERMRQSARALVLPEPPAALLDQMVRTTINANRSEVPEPPGALYIRPILFGTSANIGAAATPTLEAVLAVVVSPVWDYFGNGPKALKLLIDEMNSRSSSQTGYVKTGGNYAAALGPTLAARRQHGTDQVLFCPGGQVQETGAANFILMRKGRLLTRSLDQTFLHGVTRSSVLTLARDHGIQVEERAFDVAEMLQWLADGEAALSGTAAVLAGVGTVVYRNEERKVGTGGIGSLTQQLRSELVAIQTGRKPDPYGWTSPVAI